MFKKTIYEKNGDVFTPIDVLVCDECGTAFYDSDWHTVEENGDRYYCRECSFIRGNFTEEQFLTSIGIYGKLYKAAVHDGEILIIPRKSKFPWEKTK